MDDLRLILFDLRPAMCEAWARAFAGSPNVAIYCGRFQDIPEWDCMITTGNSFGIMDGGLDLAVRDYFGTEIETAVQEQIARDYYGEMPVGCASLVRTPHPKHPWLIYAPTMRIPMHVPAEHTYLAMAAALRAVSDGPAYLTTVLVPAFAMSTGGVPFDEGARLMALAYEYALHPPARMTWEEAVRRHQRITGERP